jgi:hypothetical protein
MQAWPQFVTMQSLDGARGWTDPAEHDQVEVSGNVAGCLCLAQACIDELLRAPDRLAQAASSLCSRHLLEPIAGREAQDLRSLPHERKPREEEGAQSRERRSARRRKTLGQTRLNALDRGEDDRVHTLAEAILWHGGEAMAAREAFRTSSPEARDSLLAFLATL